MIECSYENYWHMKKVINITTITFALLLSALAGWFLLVGEPDREVPKINEVSTDPKVKIVAFGDSLTAGYGLPASDSYPAQLETLLRSEGYDVSVINSGVSGETTRGNLERVGFILSQNPDIVILGIGGNDALRSLPLQDTRSNLEETITTLKGANSKLVILLLKMQAPLNSGLGYKREFDGLYEELANKHDLVLVPFLTTEIFFDSKNKLSDGIHYNQRGYGVVVEKYIAPATREVLESLDSVKK